MQVKIVIGTIAFMLTMIILGFVALNEPTRLTDYADAEVGRSIENGAEIFINNCATCHGVNGKAEECYDAATGEQIGCAGLPLNSADLLCGNPSPRLEVQNWAGTKLAYVRSTVASGRPWNGMPTWSQQFGGPLQPNEVLDVSNFVVNWESEALCDTAGVDVAEVEWPANVSELPAGDPVRGEELYNITYGCNACHGNPAEEGTNLIGPWLGDIADVGAERVEGYSAADYVYESILLPNAHIAPDCPNGPCTGPPSAMPANFGERMTANGMPLQDMADVMSYLLGTETFESNVEIIYP